MAEIGLAEINKLNLEEFMDEVRSRAPVILSLVEIKGRGPIDAERSALSTYLPTLVKSMLLYQDAFEVDETTLPQDSTPQAQRELNISAASGAARTVAFLWKKDHSGSGLAGTISDQGIYAPRITQLAFLREIWPWIARVFIDEPHQAA